MMLSIGLSNQTYFFQCLQQDVNNFLYHNPSVQNKGFGTGREDMANLSALLLISKMHVPYILYVAPFKSDIGFTMVYKLYCKET